MENHISSWLRKVLANIDLEDLPEQYIPIAQLIGMDAVAIISEQFGGTTTYFPKLEKIIKAERDRLIITEFDGYNHKRLAQKYGITEQWVRKIISNKNTI